MLKDDGDIVRGLGFVSMYSAWVEEDIDDILRLLDPVEPFEVKQQRWPISRKLDHAAKIVHSLESNELKNLPDALKNAVTLFDRRNEVIHGRIYASFEKVDYVQSGRPNVPTRQITSAELYELANDFWNYRGNFIGPQIFRLPRAIQKYVVKCS
ncbi:MAG: hypothetical protein M0R41_17635 [Methylobacter tundripaludum]|uniref:Uncharacterized protein n=1 Tax=Methylobacter tundripaludum TaxID=173365 RepID=A0A2S6GKF2_9GAMM|nr:hypothetical protein [Methylobacter tundripaludum]MCK9638095.1 hypothetical protein [Methylobacter tundripaludum]PPK65699.1 hypothetical protein B0F88_1191 [Methylobacter tundripaludum]